MLGYHWAIYVFTYTIELTFAWLSQEKAIEVIDCSDSACHYIPLCTVSNEEIPLFKVNWG